MVSDANTSLQFGGELHLSRGSCYKLLTFDPLRIIAIPRMCEEQKRGEPEP